MVAAVQPHLSGGVSKTINLPSSATVDDILNHYLFAWEKGLKAISVYRDGCKGSQPMNTKEEKKEIDNVVSELESQLLYDVTVNPKYTGKFSIGSEPLFKKRNMPTTRNAVVHRFKLADHKGYITAGLFEDGTLGEVFITMSKEGSTISGLMDAVASLISMSLQYGVPLQAIIDRLEYMRFEPSGFTGNQDIPNATSVLDYIAKWLRMHYSDTEPIHIPTPFSVDINVEDGVETTTGNIPAKMLVDWSYTPSKTYIPEGTLCGKCGSSLMRTGTCLSCPTCGSSSGCAG